MSTNCEIRPIFEMTFNINILRIVSYGIIK
jgi:hypothetical protein